MGVRREGAVMGVRREGAVMGVRREGAMEFKSFPWNWILVAFGSFITS